MGLQYFWNEKKNCSESLLYVRVGPVGTADSSPPVHWRVHLTGRKPGVETPGYYQASRRDAESFAWRLLAISHWF